MIKYECRHCDHLICDTSVCPVCKERAFIYKAEIYYCDVCNIPLFDKKCNICNKEGRYFGTDVRPVFPEERLLIEVIENEPFKYANQSIWNTAGNNYFINGKKIKFSVKEIVSKIDANKIREEIEKYQKENQKYVDTFYGQKYIQKFIDANHIHLQAIVTEAHQFIKKFAHEFDLDSMFVSFSGGKDSSVTSDLVMNALGTAHIIHIYGDTTLEYPETSAYIERFREYYPYTPVLVAKNNDQNFNELCKVVGPPSRLLRWCCTIFKTGAITRKIESTFRNKNKILSFQGLRRSESAARKKYDRKSKGAKIVKQQTLAPIIDWLDFDVWLYIISKKIPFNDAYKKGFSRVGCWCCPNNSFWAEYLSSIYMKDQFSIFHNVLLDFAKKVGKEDPEEYITSGGWKARQGGNGLHYSQNAIVSFQECVLEENTFSFSLNQPISTTLYELFKPFGICDFTIGNKRLGEVYVLNKKTKEPLLKLKGKIGDTLLKITIIKIPPSVKNLKYAEMLIKYQITKYQTCIACRACESVCRYNAISVKCIGEINDRKANVQYTISRKQEYRKDGDNHVKASSSKLEVIEKNSHGVQVFHESSENMAIINSILPKSLSKYFFFDGERISTMSKEVSNGKSVEFKDAVQNILGLNALNKAIVHLNPNSSSSVIGKYNAQIDENSDQQVKELRNQIYDSVEKMDKNKSRIDSLEEQIIYYKKEIEDCKNKLLNFADIQNQQRQLNDLENDLKNLKSHRNQTIRKFSFFFSNNTYKYLSRKLMKDALEILKDTDNIDNGIPAIKNTTINYLIERKKCLCGADLSDASSKEVQNLIDLLKFIPPQTLGMSISQFTKDANLSLRDSENFYNDFIEELNNIRNYANEIDFKENQIGKYDAQILSSSDIQVLDIKTKQKDYEKTLISNEEELENLKIENSILEKDINSYRFEIGKNELKVQKNEIIETERNYALAAFESFYKNYKEKEKQVRVTLEREINHLFKLIYDDGMHITIDDKYRIKTYVNELSSSNTSIDSNTAKSYSIIFAFIVGVLKMAKEKAYSREDEIEIVSNIDYPLVMDAPLSSFDQRRIENICKVIPNIARQVIIFIKDTDGNIAKEHLLDKIGEEYTLSHRNPPCQIDSVISRKEIHYV